MVRKEEEVLGTNYKKLFFKHVHEHFFLKKQVHRIDHEMEQKDRQMLEEKAVFFRRYRKFIQLAKGNNNHRRSSCSDIQRLQEDAKSYKPTDESVTTGKRKASVVEIRRNNYVEPPADFPYSFPEWNHRVDEGSYEDNGETNPRETHKEQLLKSLNDFAERNSVDVVTTKKSTNNSFLQTNKNRKLLGERQSEKQCSVRNLLDLEERQSERHCSVRNLPGALLQKERLVKSKALLLPSIKEVKEVKKGSEQSYSGVPVQDKKKVHFRTDDNVMNVVDIDRRILHSINRRKSFSEFRSLALRNS